MPAPNGILSFSRRLIARVDLAEKAWGWGRIAAARLRALPPDVRLGSAMPGIGAFWSDSAWRLTLTESSET
jgi:hypothetical protein